jgi:prophage regulatory protein
MGSVRRAKQMTDGTGNVGDRLLRLPDVKRRGGLGKTKIYALIGADRFPKPYKITAAAARWSEREIDAWISKLMSDGANA